MRRRTEEATPRPGEFVSVAAAAGDDWVTTSVALLLIIAPALASALSLTPAPAAAAANPTPAPLRPLGAGGARPARPPPSVRGADDAAKGGLPLIPPPPTPTTPEAAAVEEAEAEAEAGVGAERWEIGTPLATGSRGVPLETPGGGAAPAPATETPPPTGWDPAGAGTAAASVAVVDVELPVLLRLRLPGGGWLILAEDSACCRHRGRKRRCVRQSR